MNEYQGLTGRIHCAREKYKERWSRWKDQHPRGIRDMVAETLFVIPNSDEPPERVWQDSKYRDLFRYVYIFITITSTHNSYIVIQFSSETQNQFVRINGDNKVEASLYITLIDVVWKPIMSLIFR